MGSESGLVCEFELECKCSCDGEELGHEFRGCKSRKGEEEDSRQLPGDEAKMALPLVGTGGGCGKGVSSTGDAGKLDMAGTCVSIKQRRGWV